MNESKEGEYLCQGSTALLEYLSAGVNPALACSAQLLSTSDEAGRCYYYGRSTSSRVVGYIKAIISEGNASNPCLEMHDFVRIHCRYGCAALKSSALPSAEERVMRNLGA